MRYITYTVLLLVFFANTAIAQDKWGLRQCVEYAWQNNISVKQQEIQAKISALSEKQAKNAVYPNANFQTNLGLQFGRSVDPTTNQFTTTQLLFQQINLNADVLVFNWHRIKNSLIAAQFDYKAAQANVEKIRNDIALSVATSFLQALLNKEQIAVAQIQFEQTKSQLEATRKRVMAGALPELNATELEAQLARDSTSIINAKATAAISVLQLKATLNLDAAAPFELDVPPVEKIPVEKIADLQPEYVFQLAIQNQPAQKVNQLRLKSSQTTVKVAKAGMYPSFSAFAGLGSNFSSSFKKITGFNFTGYVPVDPLVPAPVVNVGGTNYPLQQPKFDIKQGTKSFGQLWNGYGTQLDDNFRQNFGIAVSIPIFSNGGSAKTAYERSRLDVKTAELTIQQADQQLKQDIYLAYTNALSAFERYNATLVTVAASQKTYDFAKKRYEVGLLGTFELITNQNNLNKAMTDKLLAQYEYVFRMKVLEFYKGQGLKL
ncbi:MAG: TolC family protein [Chitinophagaceae bacterium]|nr:TolC family protein [Chitinophagaceae bacterium]